MKVQPYLFFDGRCEEAVEFYRKVLGAEVEMLMRFKDSPEPHPPGMIPPGAESKIMHLSLAHRGNDGDGLRRQMPGTAELSRLLALAQCGQ